MALALWVKVTLLTLLLASCSQCQSFRLKCQSCVCCSHTVQHLSSLVPADVLSEILSELQPKDSLTSFLPSYNPHRTSFFTKWGLHSSQFIPGQFCVEREALLCFELLWKCQCVWLCAYPETKSCSAACHKLRMTIQNTSPINRYWPSCCVYLTICDTCAGLVHPSIHPWI